MARLRYNGLCTGSAGSLTALSLGASLTNSATSVTFNAALTYANGTAVPTITGSDYIPLSILDANGNVAEIVYLTAYTAAATTGTIARGKEGTTGVAHASGVGVVHPGTTRDIALKFASFSVTTGSITLNATAITPVSTSADLTLAADVGDLIEYGISARLATEAQYVGMDVYTRVGGADIAPFGPGVSASLASAQGNPGWFAHNAAQIQPITGSVTRVLTSSDVASGSVLLRLNYAKINTTARVLLATADFPLKVWAINHGPV